MPSRPIPFPRIPAFAAAALAAFVVGCGEPGSAPPAVKNVGKADAHRHDDDDHEHGDHDHDHHDDHGHADDDGHEHPTTLAGAVDAITARLASLEKAFTNEDHDEADSIVHEIGHLLEDGEDLLAKAPEAVAKKARGAWNDLGDCLAEVDEKLHAAGEDKGAVKKAYDAVRVRIGSAIDSLRGHVRTAVEPAGK